MKTKLIYTCTFITFFSSVYANPVQSYYKMLDANNTKYSLRTHSQQYLAGVLTGYLLSIRTAIAMHLATDKQLITSKTYANKVLKETEGQILLKKSKLQKDLSLSINEQNFLISAATSIYLKELVRHKVITKTDAWNIASSILGFYGKHPGQKKTSNNKLLSKSHYFEDKEISGSLLVLN
ncbi:hypothetical protein [Piscirickettsia litoralis]|uniref:Uncharacterized protein n=1 Tax=Piscirickettsia litoralis TaxID=1891921 RepID=A0ABX3A065_9GAMM|nr:hypothetical protein [Piscirickettsia litoralis]ODN41091.1 hypothetical protein BGC07_18265 [Piscirickettsia litoralis]